MGVALGGRARGWQRWCRVGAEVVALGVTPIVFLVSLGRSEDAAMQERLATGDRVEGEIVEINDDGDLLIEYVYRDVTHQEQIGSGVDLPEVGKQVTVYVDPDHPGRIAVGDGTSDSHVGRAFTDHWPAFAVVAAVVVGLAVVGNLRLERPSM